MTSLFFEAERQKFFRPVSSSRRELFVACLRAMFERLHGPAADYAHNLTRDVLKDLLLPVVRDFQDKVAPDAGQDEFNTPESDDPQHLTGVVIRALLADGWLEQFADRNGLVTAFRFSRPGKLFAEALWSLDRPSRSRQRNMRGCRNALEAALTERERCSAHSSRIRSILRTRSSQSDTSVKPSIAQSASNQVWSVGAMLLTQAWMPRMRSSVPLASSVLTCLIIRWMR